MSEDFNLYNKLKTPPQNALKTIQFGALKGKSDINPQWKIEIMTEVFGTCGVGWKFNVLEKDILDCEDGQVMVFMKVSVQIKLGDEWSEEIIGYGGDFIIKKNKNGLEKNDEAFKMCLTDGLGNALKNLGVAGDVYRGLMESKYSKQSVKQEPTKADAEAENKKTILKEIVNLVKINGFKNEIISKIIKDKFKANSANDLTLIQSIELRNNLIEWYEQEKQGVK